MGADNNFSKYRVLRNYVNFENSTLEGKILPPMKKR